MIRLGHDMFDTANMVHQADPVFGPEAEENFGRLIKCIRAEAATT
jgi:hypothetical protein